MIPGRQPPDQLNAATPDGRPIAGSVGAPVFRHRSEQTPAASQRLEDVCTECGLFQYGCCKTIHTPRKPDGSLADVPCAHEGTLCITTCSWWDADGPHHECRTTNCDGTSPCDSGAIGYWRSDPTGLTDTDVWVPCIDDIPDNTDGAGGPRRGPFSANPCLEFPYLCWPPEIDWDDDPVTEPPEQEPPDIAIVPTPIDDDVETYRCHWTPVFKPVRKATGCTDDADARRKWEDWKVATKKQLGCRTDYDPELHIDDSPFLGCVNGTVIIDFDIWCTSCQWRKSND